MTWKRRLREFAQARGYDIVPYPPPDFDRAFLETLRLVRPYTLGSPERVFAVCDAVRYVTRSEVPGAFVECGVWKGGSMMAAARTLLEVGDPDRRLYLFDTFEGMTAPGVLDRRHDGATAQAILGRERRADPESTWCRAPIEQVRTAMDLVGYPADRIEFVPGRVEDTIPEQAPSEIALLRLDTDWYDSTRHELVHLVPRLSSGGVLIIDDYGHWQGARRAVDEYLKESGLCLFLARTDETGRTAIVP
jgi:O-methyltransferase